MKSPSRLALFAGRVADRLGRSTHVFIIVLIALCGVEVAVDWNSTLYEINVLRSALAQKGKNYADLLRGAADRALASRDPRELARLSNGLFSDDEVVFVRFAGPDGAPVYERTRPSFSTQFSRRHHGQALLDHYRRQMDRDVRGMLHDPARLKEKMERSRHVDFIQRFTDGENHLIAWVTGAAPAAGPEPQALFQDRLAEPDGTRDRTLSWALGAIAAPDGTAAGVVLIAFSNRRLNRAVIGKLVKGLAMVLFFVGLILVQNLLSRRAKLRLLDLEAALSAARAAISKTLPAAPDGPLGAVAEIGIGFRQAERLGGTIYDLQARGEELELLVAVPEGAGVDAAFASVVLRDLHRRAPHAETVEAQVTALLQAYDESPLGRPIDLLLLRIAKGGEVRGVCAGLAPPARLSSGEAHPLELGAPLAIASRRLPRPLRPFGAALDGAALALFDDGLPPEAERPLAPAEVLARAAKEAAECRAQPLAEELVALAEKRWHKKNTEDLFALVLKS